MKKIALFVMSVFFLNTQIVKAAPTDGPKGYGFLKHSVRGTLEPVEFQQAMTLLFTEGSTDEQIAEFFVKIEGFSFNNMKEIYRSSFEKEFGEQGITDAEMLEIVAKMKFREVGPEYWKTHSSMFIPPGTKKYSQMEWWNPTKDRPGEYIGSCVFNGVEKDLVTTYCANPVKERNVSVKAPVEPKVEKPEVEVVIIPGTNKYFYRTDTIRERNDTYRETQNNFFLNTNNNTFASTRNNSLSCDVDMSERDPVQQCSHQKAAQCNHGQVQQCVCDGRRICDKHYDELPKKHKKKFFNSTGGRVLTHTAAAVAGYFLGKWIFGDGGNDVSDVVINQGPFVPLSSTTPVYIQAPFFQ